MIYMKFIENFVSKIVNKFNAPSVLQALAASEDGEEIAVHGHATGNLCFDLMLIIPDVHSPHFRRRFSQKGNV